MENSQLTELEVQNELRKMAYHHEDFQQLVTFVWALPDQFWARACKRLVATVLVGIQPTPTTTPRPIWHEGIWRPHEERR